MEPGQPDAIQRGIEVSLEAPKDPGRLSLVRASQAIRKAGIHAAQSNRLSWRIRESIYRQEPFFLRCVDKQTGDLVKHGFKVVKPGSEETLPENDVIQAWLRNSFVMARTRESLIAAHVHADGLVEIEWDDGGEPDAPVPADALPVAVHLIDPVGIKFLEDKDDDGSELVFLIQEGRMGEKPVTLHPDRYHHFWFHRLPGFRHAISSVEVAYHALMAKVKGDQGTGELVYNAGQPKVHAKVKDAKPGELDDTTEMINDPKFVRGYVTDDRTEIDQLNPVVFNPTPFYAEWKVSAAAAVGVPVMMGEGAQAGAVTGSETNLADYHSDLMLLDVNVLEPFFVRIVRAFIGHEGFDLTWNEPPTLPSQMAAMVREKATAFNLLRTGGLTKEAAAREAGFKLSEKDFDDEPETVMPAVTEGPNGVPAAIPRAPPQEAPGARPAARTA